MLALKIRTTSDGVAVLSNTIVHEFQGNLAGRLVRRSDDDYDQHRAVWNGMIDKKPALIARCAGTSDVVKAVNFAREHALLVSVRGGGHNVAGTAICEDGLVIALSSVNEVEVDPQARTARAQGGATIPTNFLRLNQNTQPNGR